MKMYKKNELKFVDGLLIADDGTIVAPSKKIVSQFNRFETLCQRYDYMIDQPDYSPMPSLDGFERKSSFGHKGGFAVKTPLLDAKVEDTMKLLDELDGAKAADDANEMLEEFEEMVLFICNDYVVDLGVVGGELERFDLPTLGDPLKLTEKDIIAIIGMVCGAGEVKMHIDED